MINFISLKQKENFLYEEGKKQTRKTVSVTIVTEENPTEFIKVKVEWNIERCIVTNYMIQLILKI